MSRLSSVLTFIDRTVNRVRAPAPMPASPAHVGEVDRSSLAQEMVKEALNESRHAGSYARLPGLIRAIHGCADILIESMPKNTGHLAVQDWYETGLDVLVLIANAMPEDVGASHNPATIDLIGEARDPRRLVRTIALACLDAERNGYEGVSMWADRIRLNAMEHFKKGFIVKLPAMLADRDTLATALSDGTQDLVAKLLQGTPFPKLLRVQVPLVVPVIQSRSDTWIVGPKGSGKSRLLHGNLAADIVNGYGCLVFDTQGDFSREQLRHCGLPAERIVYIDPCDPKFRPAINPCRLGESAGADAFATLFGRLMEAMGAQISAPQRGMLKYIGRIVRCLHRPTLASLTEILSGDLDGPIGRYLPSFPDLLHRWVVQHWDDVQMKPTRQALSRRLFDLQASEALGGMFSAEQTNLDLAAELDAGKLVFIRLDKQQLGDETSVTATAFLAMALAAMWGRRIGDYDNPPLDWRIYMDEFVDFLNEGGHSVLLDFLAQARKFNTGLIVAHQHIVQLPTPIKGGLKSSQVRFFARLEEPAEVLSDAARAVKSTTGFIDGLRKRPGSHGEFAVWIEDRIHEAARLRVPFVPQRKLRGRSDSELRELMETLSLRWIAPAARQSDNIISLAAQAETPRLRRRI